MLGLSVALFGACSSDENIDNNQGLKGDEAYVSLSIALPTSSRGTRANDGYDKGKEEEYNVEDLKIVYFTKPASATEDSYDDYEVVSIKDVNKSDLTWTPSSNGITTVATLPVQKVNKSVNAVLVLINNQVLNTIADGTKFSDLNKALALDNITSLTTKNRTADYFFMSNSPLSDGTTLVPVTAYPREEVAKANTKAVYVERAVAKVSFDKGNLTDNGGNWEVIPQDPYTNDKVVFTSWALDVTNKKEFPVRKYDKQWNDVRADKAPTNYRFLAATILESGKQRTYWATDPNYDSSIMPVYTNGVVDKDKSTDFNYIAASDVTTAMATPAYCTENTFDVTHMKQGETTRVIVKAQYQPQTQLEDGLNTTDFQAGTTWYRVGNSAKACNDTKLKEKVLAAVMTVTPGATAVNLVADKIVAGEQKDFSKEMFTVTDGTATDREMTDEELTAVQNALGKLTVFKGGICYYVARIRHFDDNQLGGAWDGTDYTQGASDDNRKNFLGRYGIVRNNWYQLTINSVSAPGTPTIPIPGDTPDDEQNYYLQTTVKIMDWAVRKQGLDF